MPTRYTIQTKGYSGLLRCRECISSAPTTTPRANCLLESAAEFSCIQHHMQDKKWAFLKPIP